MFNGSEVLGMTTFTN